MMHCCAIIRSFSWEQVRQCLPWPILLAALVCLHTPAFAHDGTADPSTPDSDNSADAVTIFDHPSTTRWWVSGQLNFIGQGHGSFPAEYSGPNSLKNTPEFEVSDLMTLYTGYEVKPNLQVVLDIEQAGGHGISDALGLAGFTNLDVVRNPDLSKVPYLARAIIRYTIPLGGAETENDRGWLDLDGEVFGRRIEFIAGKFSLADFFDLNDVGSDSHLQFMNWCDDQNGAWDYAANTRG